jgi:hypothetical protein
MQSETNQVKSASDYERGVIDGMQKQAKSSVDRAVNAMAQPTPAEYAMGYAEGFNDGCKPKPEQEPVAFINVEKRSLEWVKPMSWHTPTTVNLPNIPLYTTPPQCKTLTDKEIEAIWEVAMFAKYGVGAELSNQPFVHFARAIEAKLKEKL